MEKYKFQAQASLDSIPSSLHIASILRMIPGLCRLSLHPGDRSGMVQCCLASNSEFPVSLFLTLWNPQELSSPINPWQAFPSVKSYLFPWKGIVVFMVTHIQGDGDLFPAEWPLPAEW